MKKLLHAQNTFLADPAHCLLYFSEYSIFYITVSEKEI